MTSILPCNISNHYSSLVGGGIYSGSCHYSPASPPPPLPSPPTKNKTLMKRNALATLWLKDLHAAECRLGL